MQSASATNVKVVKCTTPQEALTVACGSLHGLFMKTLHAHWNSTGGRFLSIHEFTEKQYTTVLEELDMVAEHMRSKDLLAPTDPIRLQNLSIFKDDHSDISDGIKNCRYLAECHQSLATCLLSCIEDCLQQDPETQDLFVELARENNKKAWMYKSMSV